MAKNYIDYELLERLSVGDSNIELSYKVIKLGEEAGEVGHAFLAYVGSKNASKSALNGDLRENILEESCDVMNIAMDIINVMGFTDEEVKAMFLKKLKKWEHKQVTNFKKDE